MRQIIFICCLICVISCADKKAKTTTAAISPMEKVMEVHDALMPKMGTIRSLEDQETYTKSVSDLKKQMEDAITQAKKVVEGSK